jgi:hypothetical protein
LTRSSKPLDKKDPFGHSWALATVKEELTRAEIARRLEELMAQQGEAC